MLFLVLGTGTLYLTFTVSYDSSLFFKYSMVLGACWLAVFIAGLAIDDGVSPSERAPVAKAAWLGLLGGLAVGIVSVVGAWVLSLLPWTADLIAEVLGPVGADNFGPVFVTALIVGAAEELAFRGGVFALFRERPILWSTLIYAIVTCATLNPALVLATVVIGLPFAWLRQWTGQVIAPMLAHMAWTTVTLCVLSLLV